jgi:cytochrome c oxidase assembly factor CtaG
MHHTSWPVPITVVLVFVGFVYLRGWIRFRGAFPNEIPSWRAATFLGGLFCVWLAMASPLAMLDEELLTAHMVQHLLLMTFGPPLILLGYPMLMRPRGVSSPPPLFPNLVVCSLVAAAVLVVWHIPAAFDLGRSSELWHHIEHATFLAAGLLFWWPVIPSSPAVSQQRWSLVLYLFAATLPCDALSAFLAFCGRVVYSSYLEAPRHFNLSALQDQQCAGALMWTCVTFAYLIPAMLITVKLLSLSGAHEGRVTRTNFEEITLRK